MNAAGIFKGCRGSKSSSYMYSRVCGKELQSSPPLGAMNCWVCLKKRPVRSTLSVAFMMECGCIDGRLGMT